MELGINLRNCFAIATDGGSNLCGCNNSLYTLMTMRKDREDLILFKCIWHSIHLASSDASEELPSNLDYMLRETYNWFHRSASRWKSYSSDIYKVVNDGHDPMQLIQLLARSKSVERILDQWDALSLQFQIAAIT